MRDPRDPEEVSPVSIAETVRRAERQKQIESIDQRFRAVLERALSGGGGCAEESVGTVGGFEIMISIERTETPR